MKVFIAIELHSSNYADDNKHKQNGGGMLEQKQTTSQCILHVSKCVTAHHEFHLKMSEL